MAQPNDDGVKSAFVSHLMAPINACADKICEDEEFVVKAHTNSMGDLRAIFGGVMMEALLAIFSDSQDRGTNSPFSCV